MGHFTGSHMTQRYDDNETKIIAFIFFTLIDTKENSFFFLKIIFVWRVSTCVIWILDNCLYVSKKNIDQRSLNSDNVYKLWEKNCLLNFLFMLTDFDSVSLGKISRCVQCLNKRLFRKSNILKPLKKKQKNIRKPFFWQFTYRLIKVLLTLPGLNNLTLLIFKLLIRKSVPCIY